MPGLFDHVTLDSKPRLAILAELRGDSRWSQWRADNGVASNDTSIGTIRAAAEALGYDLIAAKARVSAAALVEPAALDQGSAAAIESLDSAKPAGIPCTCKGDNGWHAKSCGRYGDTYPAKPAGFEGREPDDIVAELLAPASAHITPTLAAMLPSLMRPIAEIATKPARIEVKWKQAPTPGAIVPISCNVVEWKSIQHVFKTGKGGASYSRIMTDQRIAICDCAEAPAIDLAYDWNVSALAQLGACDAAGLNAWIYGPAGTGKTEGIRHYAARTGRPCIRIAIDMSTTPEDLIGQYVLDKGNTVWRDGKLTQAFRIPYCVVLIDEPTLLHPRALAIFQTALDTRELRLASGELVKAEPGIFIVAADNTSGSGDDTGRYSGTAPMNVAFLDRFGAFIEFGHMSSASEANMLHKKTGIVLAAARIITDFASLTRGKAESGELTIGLTTRRTKAWADLVMRGMGSAKAFQAAVVRVTSAEDREKVLALETTSLTSEHARIDQLVHGSAAALDQGDDDQGNQGESPDDEPSAAGAGYPKTF